MQMAEELLLLVASEQNRGQTNQTIARYCLNHFDQVLTMNITQLAAACHVSAATITRFCHALGYDDFLHFKDECILDRRMRTESAYYCGNMFGTDSTVMTGPALDECCRAMGRDIHACLDAVDPACMRMLAEAIRAAEDVLLLGMDYSGLMMLYLQRELVKRGKITRMLLSTANLNDVKVVRNLDPDAEHERLRTGCDDRIGSPAGQRCRRFLAADAGGRRSTEIPLCDPCSAGRCGKGLHLHRYAELALTDMLLAFYGPLQKFDTNSLPRCGKH